MRPKTRTASPSSRPRPAALLAALCALMGLLVLGLPALAEEGAAAAEAEKKIVVDMKTNVGTITLELWPHIAPKSVENFLEYARSGFYAGTIFHRIERGFVIQGGGFTPELERKETRPPIPLEAKARNEQYTIAMARTGDPNSATAQFYINLKDNRGLDPDTRPPGYAVFGTVIDGKAIVDRIGETPTRPRGPHRTLPTAPIIIEEVSVRDAG